MARRDPQDSHATLPERHASRAAPPEAAHAIDNDRVRRATARSSFNTVAITPILLPLLLPRKKASSLMIDGGTKVRNPTLSFVSSNPLDRASVLLLRKWMAIGRSTFYRWIPRSSVWKALLPRSCRRGCSPLRRRSLRSWLPRHRRCAKQRLTRRLSEGTRRGAEDGREEEKKKEDRRVSLLLSRRAAARHATFVQRRSAVSSVCAVFGRLSRGHPTFDVPFCNRAPRSRAAARSRA